MQLIELDKCRFFLKIRISVYLCKLSYNSVVHKKSLNWCFWFVVRAAIWEHLFNINTSAGVGWCYSSWLIVHSTASLFFPHRPNYTPSFHSFHINVFLWIPTHFLFVVCFVCSVCASQRDQQSFMPWLTWEAFSCLKTLSGFLPNGLHFYFSLFLCCQQGNQYCYVFRSKQCSSLSIHWHSLFNSFSTPGCFCNIDRLFEEKKHHVLNIDRNRKVSNSFKYGK